MAENINANWDPNDPDATGTLYNTQIPSLGDDSNIQEALKLFMYGSATAPQTAAQIINESVAGYLKAMRSDIYDLQQIGAGSVFTNSAPVAPIDGLVWVDSNSVAAVFDQDSLSAIYSATEPVDNLNDGMLWVNAASNELFVYNGTSWDSIAAGGVAAKAYSSFSVPGLDIIAYDAVTAAAIGLNTTVFGYLDGATPTPFAVNIVSTGSTKIEVEFIMPGIFSGPFGIFRTVNGDLGTTTQIGAWSEGSIKFVDTHGQSAASLITYTFANLGTATVTLDGNLITQGIAREVA
jgi:hypothetical protein